MCTVTILTLSGPTHTVRMACNRDEVPSRPAALAPQVRTVNQRKILMPIDPISDGTWIGVNDAGLAGTLLNAYPHPMPTRANDTTPHASRGLIIPTILTAKTIDDAFDLAVNSNAEDYEAYRVILINRTQIAEVYSDGHHLHVHSPTPRRAPLMYASSGLGDNVVDGPRRALFEEMLAETAKSRSISHAMQDEYHRHSWTDRRHLSVCMERDGAQTVSCCAIELHPDHAVMMYQPEPPDHNGPVIQETLMFA